MRSSSEEAVSQLNKWRSESAKVFVSMTGLVTLWLEGRVSHASSAEVHVEIPGIDVKDFKLSFSLRRAGFEYRDRREPLEFWKPQRDESEFESVLEIRLQDGKRVVFAELRNRDI
jgi:hypothetical protein